MALPNSDSKEFDKLTDENKNDIDFAQPLAEATKLTSAAFNVFLPRLRYLVLIQ